MLSIKLKIHEFVKVVKVKESVFQFIKNILFFNVNYKIYGINKPMNSKSL